MVEPIRSYPFPTASYDSYPIHPVTGVDRAAAVDALSAPAKAQPRKDPFAKDTMAPAPATMADYTMSRPTLRLPQFQVLDVIRRQEETDGLFIDTKMKDMKEITKKFDELSLEQVKKMKALGEAAQTSMMWSIFEKIVKSLLNAANLILGASFVASGGTVVGAAMVASGALGITSSVIPWDVIAVRVSSDENVQKQIVYWVPTTLDVLSAVTGLAGASTAAIGGALNADRAKTIATTGLHVADGVTRAGKAVSDAQVSFKSAEAEQTKNQFSQNSFALEEVSSKLKGYLEGQAERNEKLGRFIKTSTRSRVVNIVA